MDYRGVLLVGMIGAAALVGALAACDAPDPGQVTFIERPKGSSGELTSGGPGGPTVEAGVMDEGGTVMMEGGSEGGPAGDPVFGTTAFAAGTPSGGPAKGNANHSKFANNDPSGQDCVVAGCHLDARPWAFAGTLYTDATGTARVPAAEIRVTGPDGKLYGSTFSDPDGNFWIELSDPKVPAGSRVGVRTATKQMEMAGAIGGAQVGCQSTACHGAGNPGKVFLAP